MMMLAVAVMMMMLLLLLMMMMMMMIIMTTMMVMMMMMMMRFYIIFLEGWWWCCGWRWVALGVRVVVVAVAEVAAEPVRWMVPSLSRLMTIMLIITAADYTRLSRPCCARTATLAIWLSPAVWL
ncbi:hypothetical protein AK812_SmicGene17997 [Symbiodinium microadriaticum]|uniref:Uncharacterized protein n=1 Tax=Symbiodinium microadriaticum TaxID=2951 RepID=A0A1Q9DWB6_SYMMI|nr:hypothetical protein AK812_SmicGene17997 [Symbiodinium microadriaticum]